MRGALRRKQKVSSELREHKRQRNVAGPMRANKERKKLGAGRVGSAAPVSKKGGRLRRRAAHWHAIVVGPQVIKMFKAKRALLGQTAVALNEAGVKSGTDRQGMWRATTVRRVLERLGIDVNEFRDSLYIGRSRGNRKGVSR